MREHLSGRLSHEDKLQVIIALIYSHYNFDVYEPDDRKLAELILKIAE